MEEKFYNDNFEKLLTEHANDFKMYPSRKAWHGIYNHLHPGRRWPSAAMSTLLVASLLLVGHLNNSEKEFHLEGADAIKNTGKTQTGNQQKSDKSSAVKQAKIVPFRTIDPVNNDDRLGLSMQLDLGINENATSPDLNPVLIASNHTTSIPGIQQPRLNVATIGKEQRTSVTENRSVNITSAIPESGSQDGDKDLVSSKPLISNTGLNESNTKPNSNTVAVTELRKQPEFKEQLQTFNETVIGKFLKSRKNKMSWKLYVTPNFSFRKYSDVDESGINNGVQLGPVNNPPAPAKSLDHRLAIGFELGGSMIQELNKSVKITAGLQFNYAGYNIKAYSVHPVMATITLNNEITGLQYPHSEISNYSNIKGSNPVILHNQQLQVSLPVGTEVKLFGNKNFQVNVGAIIQPSYVISGIAYLPSIDKRNYLLQSELLRKWNVSTAIETFASFKASNSLTMHIGPQLRYQLLSTYNNKYPAKEHLIDYGIKFGVSKTIK